MDTRWMPTRNDFSVIYTLCTFIHNIFMWWSYLLLMYIFFGCLKLRNSSKPIIVQRCVVFGVYWWWLSTCVIFREVNTGSLSNPRMPPPPPVKGTGLQHGVVGSSNPKLQVQPATPVPPPPSGATPVPNHKPLASVPEEKAQLPRIVPCSQGSSSLMGGGPNGDSVVGMMGPPQMLPPGHTSTARGLHNNTSARFPGRTIKQGETAAWP